MDHIYYNNNFRKLLASNIIICNFKLTIKNGDTIIDNL